MSGDRTPWWFSGGEDEPESVPDDRRTVDDESRAVEDEGASTDASFDWTALVSGAARMVDWATSTVMAPHAEHADPAEHPQCVVCRTILLVGDPVGLGAPRSSSGTETPGASAAAPGPEPITWIPIRDDGSHS